MELEISLQGFGTRFPLSVNKYGCAVRCWGTILSSLI